MKNHADRGRLIGSLWLFQETAGSGRAQIKKTLWNCSLLTRASALDVTVLEHPPPIWEAEDRGEWRL